MMLATYYKSGSIYQFLLSLIFLNLVSCQKDTQDYLKLGYIGEINLSGSRWLFQSSKARKIPENVTIPLDFFNGLQTGYDGCNHYGSTYTLQPNNRIDWGSEGGVSQRGCNEVRDEQLEMFIREMALITQYKIDGPTLFLFDDDNKVLLKFKLLPKIPTTHEKLMYRTWYPYSPPKFYSKAFTLQFDDYQDNTISFHGTTSCRNYKGTYQILDEDVGVIKNVGITADYFSFFCSKEDILAEKNFIQFIKNVTKFELLHRGVSLIDHQNNKVMFGLNKRN